MADSHHGVALEDCHGADEEQQNKVDHIITIFFTNKMNVSPRAMESWLAH